MTSNVLVPNILFYQTKTSGKKKQTPHTYPRNGASWHHDVGFGVIASWRWRWRWRKRSSTRPVTPSTVSVGQRHCCPTTCLACRTRWRPCRTCPSPRHIELGGWQAIRSTTSRSTGCTWLTRGPNVVSWHDLVGRLRASAKTAIYNVWMLRIMHVITDV